jgi:single-stranded DNA-binding protein
MLTIVASGYVTGEVKVNDSDYGKNATVSIRSKTTNGKQTHFINANFYGKRIDTALKYMEDGRQVTIVGTVKSISPKKKKDGTDYVAVYMDATDFSLPENQGQEMPSRRAAPASDEMPF